MYKYIEAKTVRLCWLTRKEPRDTVGLMKYTFISKFAGKLFGKCIKGIFVVIFIEI